MKQIPLNKLIIMLNRSVIEKSKGWPSPLARRAAYLLEEETGKKILYIVNFLDSLASFFGSILISIYINDPEKKFESEGFNKKILENFLRKGPTLGEWIGILREGLKHFKDQTDFFMPELLNFASGIDVPLEIDKCKFNIVKINDKQDKGLMDELNPFRLGVGHPEKISEYVEKYVTKDIIHGDIINHYEQALHQVIHDLYLLINGLKFLSQYWLFYIKNIRDEGCEKIADVYLYSSERPFYEELNVTDFIKELLGDEEFDRSLFYYKLFLANIEKVDNLHFSVIKAKKLIEVNPVLITWLKEKDFLPYRFVEWKKREKKRIFMADIIYQRGKEEIPDEDTRNRLWSVYNELKNRQSISEEKKEKDDKKEVKKEKETRILSFSQSDQRYKIVRQEIYPHLNIADEILAGIGYKTDKKEETIDIKVRISLESDKKIDSEKLLLRKAVESLWNNPGKWHSVLLGDGGMGKTTSLLRLWESFLSDDGNYPLPVFLRLEGYNQIKPERRRDFICHTIFREYHNHIASEEEIRELENQFNQKVEVNGKMVPSFILLLDGFNEVTVDNKDLLSCLDELRKFQGVQIIISSRYDMRNNHNWSEFETLNLEPLEDGQIKFFMAKQKIRFNLKLLEDIPLLKNPMMLTLYCGMEREMSISTGKEDYDFIAESRYKAEILHNFIVSSIARLDQQSRAPGDKVLHRLYLKHLLPRTGYEMEKNGFFQINYNGLRDIIREELTRYCSDEFLSCYSFFDAQITDEVESRLKPGERKNIREVIRNLKERYCFLKELGGDNYSFLHQDFRDYFSAVYIKTRTEERIKLKDNKFIELSSRVIKPQLRKMIADLAAERIRRPFIENGLYKKGEKGETVFDRLLDLLRNNKINEEDYNTILLNVIEILKDRRVDLSDTDLSGLDLSHVVLNNVILGRGRINNKNRAAKLKNSKINSGNLFPCGHSGPVTSISYNSEGNRIVSGSADETIKEWDVLTGECIRTYEGYFDAITSVCCSPDGKKIIGSSRDNTIKEWDTEDGEFLSSYGDYSHEVTALCYSPDGNKIIAGCEDGIIKEWNTDDGELSMTYEGHSDCITSINYSPDRKKILSSSLDGTIKEWSPGKEKRIITYGSYLKESKPSEKGLTLIYDSYFEGVTSVAYSPDGKKIIAAYEDGVIREWKTGKKDFEKVYEYQESINFVCYSPCGKNVLFTSGTLEADNSIIIELDREKRNIIKQYKEHHYGVNSARYINGGKEIISAGSDRTIKKWDTLSGECIKTYKGYFAFINSVNYSKDGFRILYSGDGVKEWNIKTGDFLRAYAGESDEYSFASYVDNEKNILSISSDGRVYKWVRDTGECLENYRFFSAGDKFLACSPDGSKIVSRTIDNKIILWDVNRRKDILIDKEDSEILSISFNLSEDKLFLGYKNIIRIFNIETGEELKTLELLQYKISRETIEKLKERIISKKIEFLKVWVDIELCKQKLLSILEKFKFTGEEINVILNEAKIDYTYKLIFLCSSPDGKKILSINDRGDTLEEWDVLSGEHSKSFYTGEYCNRLSSVIYNYDGKKILSLGKDDNTIEEWNVLSGEHIQTYSGHTSPVKTICYSPEGDRILSGSKDNSLKEWDVSTGKCIKKIENKFGLFIQGADLSVLSPDSEINDEEKGILKEYGAII